MASIGNTAVQRQQTGSGLSRMHNRLDRLTAILIDTVVNHPAQLNIFAAASILAKNGVPLAVALRVLTRPWEGRHRPTPPLVPCGK